MSERTPMETLRRLEALLERMEVHWTGSTRETAREALAMLRELREGAVEGCVSDAINAERLRNGGSTVFMAWEAEIEEREAPALLLTTKPRGGG